MVTGLYVVGLVTTSFGTGLAAGGRSWEAIFFCMFDEAAGSCMAKSFSLSTYCCSEWRMSTILIDLVIATSLATVVAGTLPFRGCCTSVDILGVATTFITGSGIFSCFGTTFEGMFDTSPADATVSSCFDTTFEGFVIDGGGYCLGKLQAEQSILDGSTNYPIGRTPWKTWNT
uniref:Uncharacterized protein n=1 Tax=Anopheles coluzzii TaxID=1518534 RepID=A0A8W7PK46_ANOCL